MPIGLWREALSWFPAYPPMTSSDYVGLGPCMQDPAWVKMSSPAQVNKKRKKADIKPQSQLNKCLNEKRRREQENTHIEELAELIQASIASDMSSLSVKPDKCAILQQTVNQIRRIKASEGAAGESAVQQGEVSSSRPSLLPTQRLGPLLLEALDGFIFLVSTEGKIEFVSDKVSQFIKFTSEDLTSKSIYNIIHVGPVKQRVSPRVAAASTVASWSSLQMTRRRLWKRSNNGCPSMRICRYLHCFCLRFMWTKVTVNPLKVRVNSA